MPDVSIVIPVLNRPHRAAAVCSSIFEHSTVDVEVLFVCSPNDDLEIEAVAATGENFAIVDWEPGPGDFARKHNRGFQATSAPYVFLGADDLEFTPGWDRAALNTAWASNAGVIGTDDRANPLVMRRQHATHPLVARRYIDERGGTWHDGPGVVYCEEYHHQYVDNELVVVAKERREWAFAFNSFVIHHHPLFPQKGGVRTEMDSTYKKALADSAADRAIYLERMQRAKAKRVGSR